MADGHTHVEMVDRPHAGWWISVLGGMAVLGVIAYHPGAYRWWCATATTALSQGLLQFVFIAAWLAHIGEAVLAFRLAQRAGLQASAAGWFLQTFALGYPSLRLLRARAGRS